MSSLIPIISLNFNGTGIHYNTSISIYLNQPKRQLLLNNSKRMVRSSYSIVVYDQLIIGAAKKRRNVGIHILFHKSLGNSRDDTRSQKTPKTSYGYVCHDRFSIFLIALNSSMNADRSELQFSHNPQMFQ